MKFAIYRFYMELQILAILHGCTFWLRLHSY